MTTTRPRAVLLVANPAAPYSRALRVARSLDGAGFEVEIAAVAAPGVPPIEHDGPILIRRYQPVGPWARFTPAWTADERPSRGAAAHAIDLALKAIGWPAQARGWWAALRRDRPPAELYHAFGLLALPIALELASGARAAGRPARVVHDVIDLVFESQNVDRMPGPLRAALAARERRWARRADATVTVNEPIAEHLRRAWRLASTPLVLPNTQPRWTPPVPRPNLIREALGLPPARRIVLFLGRVGPGRGRDEAAEAVLRLPVAALVSRGFGPWADRLRARDGSARFAGRHFTLPAVHPDDLPAWTASADVSVIPVPGETLNQRLSTPNKFWESIAAGTPLVVGRDLQVMSAIVERDGLGAVADPADPADLARALASVLELPAEDYEALRARVAAVAAARDNWEASVGPYLALVSRLVPGLAGPGS